MFPEKKGENMKYLLKGGTIVTPERIIYGADILINNDKIEKVNPRIIKIFFNKTLIMFSSLKPTY